MKYLDLIVVTILLTVGTALLTYVDASSDKKPRKNEISRDSIDQRGYPEETREKAVQKVIESQHHNDRR
jgi:hypothetical protein